MTLNRHLSPWLYATFFLGAPACDFSRSSDSAEDGGDETGTPCTGEALICPDGTAVGREGPNCEFTPCPGDVPCTDDAKICPDGTAVGREGPNCEFAPCPGDVPCTLDAMICPDGSAVGREGPDCEFAPCPSDHCAADACGPMPDVAQGVCEDGSSYGPLCQPDEVGECAWTIRQCGVVACTADARQCWDGSTVGRQAPDCEFAPCPGECEPSACGPRTSPDEPRGDCPDGTMSGEFCMEDEDGACGWEVHQCNVACQDDARVCPDGTVLGRVGPDCEFPECPSSCEDENGVHATPAGCPGTHAPVLPAAGCYQPCETAGDACEGGGVCMAVQTNPCVCPPDAQGCCAACASDALFCMPPETDSICGYLVGHSFASDEEYECGETPTGYLSCHWQISFTEDEFTWFHSDIGEISNYDCDEGTIVADRFEGTFDASTGRLLWDGIEYTIVQ